MQAARYVPIERTRRMERYAPRSGNLGGAYQASTHVLTGNLTPIRRPQVFPAPLVESLLARALGIFGDHPVRVALADLADASELRSVHPQRRQPRLTFLSTQAVHAGEIQLEVKSVQLTVSVQSPNLKGLLGLVLDSDRVGREFVAGRHEKRN
jgi:hypothetical protein